MKLDYKKTIFVGFAFFLICAFWQAYDNTIPLILTNKFGLSQGASGVIMALDNILALFMLPLFGAISDKCRHKLGRRTPFILYGTIIAAVAFVGLSLADNMQLKQIRAVSAIDDPAALTEIYQAEQSATLQTPDYTNYVVPARQAYAWNVTRQSTLPLVLFMVLLLIVLVSMATFRSPAVALMPDVTIKPLRSKANAIINLMGSAGGILVLVLGMVFATSSVKHSLMSYTGYFAVIAGVMLLALVIFRSRVKEPELVKQMKEESRRFGIAEDDDDDVSGGRKLTGEERRSLFFLLASIVLWFMGYNAVTSKYSVYASNILHKDYNLTLIIAQAAAILAYLPVGIVASKIGRKKTIFAGILMLTTAFGVACFLRESSPTMLMNAMFALAGIGWATINVNSFPMVVELCRGGDVGKYTGFYYTASMAAQTVTPMISGFLMDQLGMTTLFPYATIFVALAFVTMIFVLHGDNKPTAKKGLESLDVED